MIDDRPRTIVRWVGSSLADLRKFPRPVRRDLGYGLDAAQLGDTDPNAKPLKGFPGARVLEIRSSHRSDTFRAVYTVQFAEVIYVLHAFQKKSKRGIATPKKEMDMIKTRLKEAEEIHRALEKGGER
ncbi:MAG: type II toxin-antitoxin system RelE/ParE family toxin [Rhodospirillales bacterium]|nr:type II toxin-antitoxin system RelE/ParE family toxin [Rhodospirillales bacterium]